MKNNNNQKIQFYVNTDKPEEKEIYDLIENQKNKSEYIRTAIIEYEKMKETEQKEKAVEDMVKAALEKEVDKVISKALAESYGVFTTQMAMMMTQMSTQMLQAINSIEVKPTIIQAGFPMTAMPQMVPVAAPMVEAPAEAPETKEVEESVKDKKMTTEELLDSVNYDDIDFDESAW